MDEHTIRAELGEILDRLPTLPADAFAERGALRDRQEELRRGLAAIDVPGADAIKRRWSEQAGSKPPIDEGEPVIVSPIESGGGT
jgi:hypothetical protein